MFVIPPGRLDDQVPCRRIVAIEELRSRENEIEHLKLLIAKHISSLNPGEAQFYRISADQGWNPGEELNCPSATSSDLWAGVYAGRAPFTGHTTTGPPPLSRTDNHRYAMQI